MLVGRGTAALLGGRLHEAERLAAAAAHLSPSKPAPALLGVAACREQGRFAEAELRLRGVLADHPACAEGHALLAAVLADLGRDADARRQLDLVCAAGAGLPPAVAAPAAEAAAALGSADHGAALAGPLAAHGPAGAGWHGSLARHLALVHHVTGHWERAEAHFRTALAANTAAGAPVLRAHTQRDIAALLRVRGGPGDWEAAIESLSLAAAVYRRLEIEPRAEHAEVVLRRSEDPGDGGTGEFCRAGAGWEVAFGGQRAVLTAGAGAGVGRTAGAGLEHLAAVLAAAGRPQPATELVEAGADPTGEYRARVAELDAEADAPASPLAAALARAERDALLAGAGPDEAPGAGAGRLVAFRVRSALDLLDATVPALGHHLRLSTRVGTYCSYEPAWPQRWKIRR